MKEEVRRVMHPIAVSYQITHLMRKIKKQQNPDLRSVLEQRLKYLEHMI